MDIKSDKYKYTFDICVFVYYIILTLNGMYHFIYYNVLIKITGEQNLKLINIIFIYNTIALIELALYCINLELNNYRSNIKQYQFNLIFIWCFSYNFIIAIEIISITKKYVKKKITNLLEFDTKNKNKNKNKDNLNCITFNSKSYFSNNDNEDEEKQEILNIDY